LRSSGSDTVPRLSQPNELHFVPELSNYPSDSSYCSTSKDSYSYLSSISENIRVTIIKDIHKIVVMDEDISGFAAITGATPQVARHFLTMTEGILEQAIQLYFDSPDLSSSMVQDAPPTSTSQPARPKQASTSRGRVDASGVIHLDSDDEDVAMDEDFDYGDSTIEQQTASATAGTGAAGYDDDEAMARRMQEELYAGGDMAGGYAAESVRAPIARTTETLVGPGANWGEPADMHDAVLQQLRARQQPRSSRLFLQSCAQNIADEDFQLEGQGCSTNKPVHRQFGMNQTPLHFERTWPKPREVPRKQTAKQRSLQNYLDHPLS
jgi:hypothetical protein